MELDGVAVSGDRVGCFMFMVCTVDFEFYGAGEPSEVAVCRCPFYFLHPFLTIPFLVD